MLESFFAPISNWGLFIVRLALAIIFVQHGWAKLNPNGPTKGPAGFIGWLGSMKVPLPWVAGWGVILVETLGALLLVVGILPRLMALLLCINMIVAIVMVKLKGGFIAKEGVGWEWEFMLAAAALALLFTGAGTVSLNVPAGW